MYPQIRLSRLELIDNYQKFMDTCPTFVLMFLANSLAIKFNPHRNSIDDLVHAIQKISRTQPYLEENDLRGLAGFINPHVDWDKESLTLAFKDAYNFMPQIPILPSRPFSIKTPDEPLNVDEFMMFQICVRYGIPLSREMTFEECQKAIGEWSSRLTPLRQSIFQRLCQFSRQRLLSIKSHFVSSESLEDLCSAGVISNTSSSSKSASASAVDKIARYYRLDATESECPEEELALLERTESDFVPVCLEWRRKFLINPSYYHLDSRYIPKYDSLYQDKARNHLRYLSGVSYDLLGSIDNAKTSSLVIGLDPNINPSMNKNTSIMFEHIPMCHTERLKKFISSDRYTNHEKKFPFIVTREELLDWFNSKGNFTIPSDPLVEFGDADLNMISRNSVGHEIVSLIKDIKETRERDISETIICLKALKSTDIPIKLLKELENLGLTMRGWETAFTDINDVIKSKCSYDSIKYQEQIEERTEAKIKDLMKDPRTLVLLSRIPLMKIRKISSADDSVSAYDSSAVGTIVTYGKGISVKDRLTLIVTDPEDNNACMRINSNMILITSHFFMTQTELVEPLFNIEDLYCLPG